MNQDNNKIINDLFTVALKNNNIFIRIKDENGKIIYPLDMSTLSRIDSILKNSEQCISKDVKKYIEVYDKIYNKYYKIINTMYPLDGKTYQMEFIEDISLEKHYEEESKYDSNTGVYNSRAIMQKMEECIINKNNDLSNFSVVICDIDDFKKFNDQYSHLAGDEVLKTLANIFKNHVSNDGYVGRYGGDEFVIILKNYDCKKTLEMVSKIINEVKKLKIAYLDITIENISISCGISDVNHIGPYCISNTDDVVEVKDNLFNSADKALYEVKESGKGQAIIYNSNNKVKTKKC